MRTNFANKGRLFAGAGIAALSLAVMAGPAYAQDADGNCIDADEDGECDAPATTAPDTRGEGNFITVTGSRIRLPETAESKAPLVVLDEEYIEDRNLTNVADALNELPIYQGSVTPAGAQGTFGQGVNFVNTFGLGSNRTLTLINGRRFVNSNPPTVFNNSAAGTQVDLNVVPSVLIDRIETVAVGGAPIYGSDAIGATTNVILNTKFDDIVLSATTGITERGDNFRYNISAVAGVNLLDDTLNITAAISHDEVDGLLLSDRPYLFQNIQTLTNNVPVGSLADSLRVNPNLSNNDGDEDGNPPSVQFRNTGIPFLSRGGVIFSGPLTLSRQFDTQGNLVEFDTGLITNGIRGIGGEGFQFGDFAQITSDVERTTGNLFVTWEFVPNIEAYAEGWYFESRADELVQQPTFNTVLFGGSSGAPFFTIDNPFLTDQARGVLQDAGVGGFFLSRVNLDLADTTGFGENEVKRGVLGIRGEFEGLGRVWNFDASYNRGRSEVVTFGQDINRQNFINAISVDANGNCTTDPDLATGFAPGGAPVADPNCVGLNILGEGRASQAALDYIINDTTAVATLDQEVFNVNLGSTLFDLWGAGPIGFNIGYEHRREEGSFTPDQFQLDGLGRSVAIEAVSGSYNLDEVFGEVVLPVVSPDNNIPVIDSFELFGSARYVDNTVNGGFTAWSAGARLSPIEDITFRGNFTRSFRAPAIAELFSPQAGAFGFIGAPCREANIPTAPDPAIRQANCDAFLAEFPNANVDLAADASIPVLLGGNPNLLNEEADAWTIGVVFQPRFIDRFVLAVDYVNVEINNPIIFLETADIVAGCFDNPDFDASDPANANQFCSLIRRQPAGTIGPDPRGPNPDNPDGDPIDIGGFVINDPLNPGVTTGFANGVQFNYEALQAVMSWTLPDIFGGPGTLNLNGSALYTLKRDFNNLGVVTDREDGTFGDPTFTAQLNVRYYTDSWGTLFSTNFVGRQLATREERSLDIREINRRDPYALFNTSVYFDVEEDFRFTFAVTNLFDRIEQNDYFGTPNGTADALGRRFSVTARTRF